MSQNRASFSVFPFSALCVVFCVGCSQELPIQNDQKSSGQVASVGTPASATPPGGSTTPPGTSPPVASKPACGVSFTKSSIIVGVDSLSWSWTSSLSAGMVGQTNVVYNSSNEVLAIHRDAVANFGVGPGSKTVDARTVASWITAFLINHPTITIAFEPHESSNGVNWQNCNVQPAQLKVSRRSLDLGTCDIPVGVEQTSCGGPGTKVFLGGVCQVISSSANADLNQKFFECAEVGNGTKDWQAVTIMP